MNEIDIKAAIVDIESTSDLLERALKLSGLITTLFQRHGFPLVVVGGSAVEFYTEGGGDRPQRRGGYSRLGKMV